MTVTDIVARVRISEVAKALNIKLDRTRRRGVVHPAATLTEASLLSGTPKRSAANTHRAAYSVRSANQELSC
jgi:hypothetical protein